MFLNIVSDYKLVNLLCGWLCIVILVWIRNQLDVTYVLSSISPLQVAQHVSGNHVPIFRSWRLQLCYELLNGHTTC